MACDGVPRAGGEADYASNVVFGVLCGVCALVLLPAMAAVLGCMPCVVRWGGVEVWRRAARVLVANFWWGVEVVFLFFFGRVKLFKRTGGAVSPCPASADYPPRY